MASQWKRQIKAPKALLRKIVVESYISAGSQVFIKSPVASGDFKNNWNASLNAASNKPFVTGRGKDHNQASDAMAKISESYKLGDTLYLTNPAPYAIRLEYGWSAQFEGKGMVRIAAAQWKQTVSKVVARLK